MNLEAMYPEILVPLFALYNRARGSKYGPKLLWYFIMGATFTLVWVWPLIIFGLYSRSLDIIYWLVPAMTAIFYIGYQPGWHDHFSSLDGRERRRGSFPKLYFIKNTYLRGIIGMSLRYLVFFLPLWGLASFYYHNSWVSWAILGLSGPLYYLAGVGARAIKKPLYDVPMAELLTGALMGYSLYLYTN